MCRETECECNGEGRRECVKEACKGREYACEGKGERVCVLRLRENVECV